MQTNIHITEFISTRTECLSSHNHTKCTFDLYHIYPNYPFCKVEDQDNLLTTYNTLYALLQAEARKAKNVSLSNMHKIISKYLLNIEKCA